MVRKSTSSKTIAKNTLFLYFRMMFTMLVALYTSRVVLQVLGVDDFGIYHAVGGFVSMLTFLNSALSAGSSRFLTFELGRGDAEQLSRTFSTSLVIHILLALAIAAATEVLGLWFIHHKLIIPPDRLEAAVFTFHFSVLTTIVTITQVPYTASIISHERMEIYAYMSILDVTLKLLIVYLLTVSSRDSLKLYALLIFAVQTGLAFFYRHYCVRRFTETHFRLFFDRAIFRNILSYSSWSLIAAVSGALINQGTTVLLNMFFSPAVVSARAIANQVNVAANQFVQNFRTAANPQIIKRYAAGDFQGSKGLLLESTRISYYLMLLLCLPTCLVARQLLELWLHEVPEYTTIFLQLTIVTSLFHVFDSSFYTALYAKGQIRENALISPVLAALTFPVSYLLFRCGYSPVALAWVLLLCFAVLGLVVKPILVIRIVDYTWRDIWSVFYPCIKVTLLALPLPLFLQGLTAPLQVTHPIVHFFSLAGVAALSVLTASWFFGIDAEKRRMLLGMVLERVARLRKGRPGNLPSGK